MSPTESLLKPIIDAGKSKTFILIQNGLGIEEGLYAATRAIDATILSSVIHISTNLIGNRDEVLFERTERLEIGVYHPPTDGRPPVTDDSAAAWVPKPTAVQAAALTKFKEVLEAGGGAVTIEQDMELFRFRKVPCLPPRIVGARRAPSLTPGTLCLPSHRTPGTAPGRRSPASPAHPSQTSCPSSTSSARVCSSSARRSPSLATCAPLLPWFRRLRPSPVD